MEQEEEDSDSNISPEEKIQIASIKEKLGLIGEEAGLGLMFLVGLQETEDELVFMMLALNGYEFDPPKELILEVRNDLKKAMNKVKKFLEIEFEKRNPERN